MATGPGRVKCTGVGNTKGRGERKDACNYKGGNGFLKHGKVAIARDEKAKRNPRSQAPERTLTYLPYCEMDRGSCDIN